MNEVEAMIVEVGEPFFTLDSWWVEVLCEFDHTTMPTTLKFETEQAALQTKIGNKILI